MPDGGHSQTTELLEETPPLLLRGGYFFMYIKIPKITRDTFNFRNNRFSVVSLGESNFI